MPSKSLKKMHLKPTKYETQNALTIPKNAIKIFEEFARFLSGKLKKLVLMFILYY